MNKSPGPNRGLRNIVSLSSTNLIYLLIILNFFLLDLDFSQAAVSNEQEKKNFKLGVLCASWNLPYMKFWCAESNYLCEAIWQMICVWLLREKRNLNIFMLKFLFFFQRHIGILKGIYEKIKNLVGHVRKGFFLYIFFKF